MYYVAYNRLYKKGIAITKPYRVVRAKTYSEAKRQATNTNRRWNNLAVNKKQRLKAKLVKIVKRTR